MCMQPASNGTSRPYCLAEIWFAARAKIPVVLLDAYQERSSTISSHPIEIPAYVPFFQTGDPKPITRGITGPSGHYARPSVAHVCH